MMRQQRVRSGTAALAVEDADAAGQTTVLIVDDHSAIREGLKAALGASADFRVIDEASDAEQALDLVQKTSPDIVIMDISMPGRNGIEAAKEIHLISPSTRVVAYTMYAESGFVAGMAKAGVNVYVLKGEPLATLLDALHLAREGKTRVPDALLTALPEPDHDGQAAPEDKVRSLSRREREVFLILADGHSVKQAAFDLGLSPKTVETYKYRLMRKLNADNVVDLAKIAFRAQLMQP
jgi:DNA-binding NarL/FixJ family response regulator